ncbi:very long chain fatty acid elongase 7-like [Chironomus tepperi]|uniref:very long chain fatty acid elongase 7-like n=1 Tax=Chironomus tepperi TaxID=113505 RepID=UPI00391F9860
MGNMIEKISDFWINEADPRSKQMFIIKSPFPIISILVIYFVVLKLIIPLITNNKKHPHLRHILSFYYVIHSVLSIAIILIWFIVAFKTGYNLRCEPISYSDDFYTRLIIFMSEVFLWFKFSEMLETFLLAIVNGRAPIFNILHHTLYPCMLAIGIRFYPGGSPAFFALINCIEHALLYTVLAMRQISNKFKKSCTWFKKFHIILSVSAMLVSIIFYIQMETRPDCDFTVFRYYVLTCLFIFSFVGIYFRWSYILQSDAFGDTWMIKAITKAKIEGKGAMLISNKNSSRLF